MLARWVAQEKKLMRQQGLIREPLLSALVSCHFPFLEQLI
jgi:hypothetical protein